MKKIKEQYIRAIFFFLFAFLSASSTPLAKEICSPDVRRERTCIKGQQKCDNKGRCTAGQDICTTKEIRGQKCIFIPDSNKK